MGAIAGLKKIDLYIAQYNSNEGQHQCELDWGEFGPQGATHPVITNLKKAVDGVVPNSEFFRSPLCGRARQCSALSIVRLIHGDR